MVDIFLVALRLVVKQWLQAGHQPTGHRELTLKDDASFFGCGQTADPTPGNFFYHRDVVALYIFIIAGLPYIATALRDRTNTDGNEVYIPSQRKTIYIIYIPDFSGGYKHI